MSDQIANELVNELVGEATNDFRRRRVSWYDEVEAEEAPGASGSTEHAQGASITTGGQVWPVMQADIRYPHPEDNINGNPGAPPPFNWGRVVESLIRGMPGTMERAPESGNPLPFTSGREKANCGVQIRVAIKPLPGALGI